MELSVCSECGAEIPRVEKVNGRDVDHSLEEKPMCRVCRGEPGATPYHRKRDILGGFPWKRDPVTGKKVPK